MSELTIKSGDSGNVASVDDKKRLATFAVTEPEAVNSSLQGETYFIGTGIINLSTAGESHIMYVKNTDTVDWVVEGVLLAFGKSTGATGLDFLANFTVGGTQGTLISAGSDISVLNMNIGNAKQLTGEFKEGVEGSTVTNGFLAPALLVPSDSINIEFVAGPIIIAKGTSVAVSYVPATGNTSINVNVGMTIYRNLV